MATLFMGDEAQRELFNKTLDLADGGQLVEVVLVVTEPYGFTLLNVNDVVATLAGGVYGLDILIPSQATALLINLSESLMKLFS